MAAVVLPFPPQSEPRERDPLAQLADLRAVVMSLKSAEAKVLRPKVLGWIDGLADEFEAGA